MKIRVLGTRGYIDASKPWHTLHSGVLVDDCLLLDVGEQEFLQWRPRAVLITHLHPDHAWFVTGEAPAQLEVPLYGPEEHEKVTVNVLKEAVTIEDYRVTPVPTVHSVLVQSQGYVIEKDGVRIFYSGDMLWIEKKHHDLLHDLDMVVTEGSYIRRGGMVRRHAETGRPFGHTGIPDLVRLFSRFTTRIVFMHFGSWFFEDVPKSRKQIASLATKGLKIEVARDGQEFLV